MNSKGYGRKPILACFKDYTRFSLEELRKTKHSKAKTVHPSHIETACLMITQSDHYLVTVSGINLKANNRKT
jgi:hypothetical protein